MITPIVIPTVIGSSGRPTNRDHDGANPDQSGHASEVEREKQKIPQTQPKANGCSHHARWCCVDARRLPISIGEYGRHHGPHSTQKIVISRDGVRGGEYMRDQRIRDQARNRQQYAWDHYVSGVSGIALCLHGRLLLQRVGHILRPNPLVELLGCQESQALDAASRSVRSSRYALSEICADFSYPM